VAGAEGLEFSCRRFKALYFVLLSPDNQCNYKHFYTCGVIMRYLILSSKGYYKGKNKGYRIKTFWLVDFEREKAKSRHEKNYTTEVRKCKTEALAEAGIDIRRANEADTHVPAAILD